jgi:hypothetical protein
MTNKKKLTQKKGKPMKITSTILASILFLAGSLVISSQSLAQDACGEESNSYKLMIHVNRNKPTKVTHKGKDADKFHVCNGDEVEWQIVGSGKQYWLNFLDGAPFSGGKKKNSNSNGKINVVIDGEAGPDGYKYDIGIVDGGVLDPRIIIGD